MYIFRLFIKNKGSKFVI